MKFLFLLSVVLISTFSFAQRGVYEVSLEISGLRYKNTYTRIDLFIENDSTAIVEIRSKPLKPNEMLIERPKADMSHNISVEQFNEIIDMLTALSVEHLLIGMNPNNPSLRSEPTEFKLTIRVMQESVVFEIVEPSYDTKERNLEQYLAICNKILSLTKLKPKKCF